MITLEYTLIQENKPVQKSLSFSKSLLTMPYNETSLFVIQVDGQSMEPRINDRALVVSDLSQREIEDEGIYLVYHEEKMWIKQAKIEGERITFVSINPDYSHLVYKENEVRVVAKALLTFTSL